MKHLLIGLFLLSGQLALGQSYYSYKEGSYDGIGKWYMGREISYVMGYQGMQWLERPEREKEERMELLIQNMEIKPSDVIADIGAGSGVHVFKMAPLATEGIVYGIDIQPQMLDAIKAKNEKLGLKNVKTVQSTPRSIGITKEKLDKVLLVDVYHEFEFPREMMESVHKALKPGGLVFLIEYRKEDPNVPIKELHKMSEAQAVKEMNAVGFDLVENKSNLPWQHCLIFSKS